MEEKAICEITLTSFRDREWQGSVYFPDCGLRLSFPNLMELVRTVEHRRPPGEPDRQSPGT